MMRASRENDLLMMINDKIPQAEVEFNNEEEKSFYASVWAEAVEHEKQWKRWPVFEMTEIESDDPRLDIYNEPV